MVWAADCPGAGFGPGHGGEVSGRYFKTSQQADRRVPPAKPPNPQTGSVTVSGPASLCDPWREQIEAALERGLSIQRIYQDLVLERRLPAVIFRCAGLCCAGWMFRSCRSGAWSARRVRSCRWISARARG